MSEPVPGPPPMSPTGPTPGAIRAAADAADIAADAVTMAEAAAAAAAQAAAAMESDDDSPAPPDPNAPRHRAAQILAWLFCVAFLTVIFAEMAATVYWNEATSDEVTTLMLTIGSLLVGVTGGYLARNVNKPPGGRVELESKVGTILVVTLGGMLVIMAMADLWETFQQEPDTGLSSNALNVLAVLLSGIVGILGGYLGITGGNNRRDR